jgi:hypothetical protein
MREEMIDLYESAARLQKLMPTDDICLVGGSAVSYYAEHRMSVDHDHVMRDLASRFDMVLEALQSQGDWLTNRVIPGKIILGELGDIEAGIRQLIRKVPLDAEKIVLPSGNSLTIPTLDETLRIKAYLLVKRNQVRDYLDVAALAKCYSLPWAAGVLLAIDDYYADDTSVSDAVASQLVMMLGDARPKDLHAVDLYSYKHLEPEYQDWHEVERICRDLAAEILNTQTSG